MSWDPPKPTPVDGFMVLTDASDGSAVLYIGDVGYVFDAERRRELREALEESE